jgi:hypothetical protein
MFGMKPTALLIVSLILSVTTTTTFAAGENEHLFVLPPQRLTVVRTPKPPVIDGQINDSEWRYATAVSGFVNLANATLADERTTAYITYDDTHLYLAFDSKLTTERSPAARESGRDSSVWNDEAIEIHLLPEGRDEARFYQIVFNSAGAVFDRMGRDKSHDFDITVGNDAGMGYWTAEVSIRLADLGIDDPTGQTWRGNLCRSAGMFTCWALSGKGYINPPHWGEIVFADQAQVIQVTTFAPEGSEIVIAGTTFNPTDTRVFTDLSIRLPELDAQLKRDWPDFPSQQWRPLAIMNVLPNGTQDFRLTRPARDDVVKLVQFAARERVGTDLKTSTPGELRMRQAVPWQPKEVRFVSLLSVPDEQRAFVRVDGRALGVREPVAVRLEAKLRDGDAQRVIELPRIDPRGNAATPIDISDWPAGLYDVAFVVAHNGNVIKEGTFEYERRDPPTWYSEGMKLGRSRKVPPPWTAIDLDGDRAVTVWGRTHDLSGSLLLSQVSSKGSSLLAAPVRLVSGDNEANLQHRRSIEIADDRCVWISTGKLGDVDVELRTTIEFDGMIRYDLSLSGGTIDDLQLVVPFRREHATYFHYASSYFGTADAMLMPEDGVRSAFRPFIWIGDNDRGIMWFAESQAGWRSGGKPIEVRHKDSATELVIHLVDKPNSSADRQITFGLHATPVKPTPRDYRSWRMDRVWHRTYPARQAVKWEDQGISLQWRYLWWTARMERIFTEGHTTPLKILPEQFDEQVQAVHAQGTRVLPYMYLYGVNHITTDYDRFYPAWQTMTPRQMPYWGRIIMDSCIGSSVDELLLYGIDQWVKNHDIDGMYFDGAGPPMPCDNPLHGHGWIDEDGNRQPSFPVFSLRAFYKRLWIILTEQHADPVIWVHADGMMPTPCFAFVTANWEGEMVQGAIKGGELLLSDIKPPAFWRGHMLSDQWGVVQTWLPSVFGSDAQRLRQQGDTLATLLVHGVPFARVGSMDVELIHKIWRAQVDFAIDSATFHPYWKSDTLLRVEPANDRLLVSFYERDGRVMMVAANLTDEPATLAATFTGVIQPTGNLRDAVSDATLTMTDGSVKIDVPPRNFRILVSE